MLSLFENLSILKDDLRVIRPLALKRIILSNFGKLMDFSHVRSCENSLRQKPIK